MIINNNFIKGFKFCALGFVFFSLYSCTNGGRGGPSIPPVPKNAKVVDFNIHIGPSASITTTGTSVFNLSLKCDNVFEADPLIPGSADWSVSNVLLSTDTGPQSSIPLIQYIGNRAITCHIRLVSAQFNVIGGTANPETFSPKSASDSDTFILDIRPPIPDAQENLSNLILSTNASSFKNDVAQTETTYDKSYDYVGSQHVYTFTHGFIVADPSVTDLSEVSPEHPKNYAIGFTFHPSSVKNVSYTKNSSVSGGVSVSESISVLRPEDPNLSLTQTPSSINSGTNYLYRLSGKAFLSNTGTNPTSFENEVGTYFRTTSWLSEAYLKFPGGPPVLPLTDVSLLNSLALVSHYLFQGDPEMTHVNDISATLPYLPSAETPKPYENIVRYANACKIFVIADGSPANPDWYATQTVGASVTNTANPFPFIWKTGSTPTNDFPTMDQITASALNPLTADNLNALMGLTEDGTKGIYSCNDLSTYYSSDVSYNNAVGASNRVIINDFELPGPSGIRDQYYNWGNDDIAGASASNAPGFNRNKVLIVYENVGAGGENAFTYSIINPSGPKKPVTASGDFDSFFGTNGIVYVTQNNFNPDYAADIAVQADGKILVLSGTDSPHHFLLLRLNIDGSFDTTFGSGGFATLPANAFGGDYSSAQSLAIQPNGKIVVAGYSNNGIKSAVALARFTSAGALDTTLNTTGKILTDISGSSASASSVLVQPNGKIVVGCENENFALLIRYNDDGSLDTSFDTDGIAQISPVGDQLVLNKIILQADGKIVGAGRSTSGINNSIALLRVNSNGSLDTTFDTDGIVTTFSDTLNTSAFGLGLQSDGKIVIAGTKSDTDVILARYFANGSLDTSFNSTGSVLPFIINAPASLKRASDLAIQADGKIVAVGNVSDTSNGFFVRYNADGTIDSANFGSGSGRVITSSSLSQSLLAVTIQSDGKIVALGRVSTGGGAIIRLR